MNWLGVDDGTGSNDRLVDEEDPTKVVTEFAILFLDISFQSRVCCSIPTGVSPIVLTMAGLWS